MLWDLLARTMVQEILQIVQANMLDYTTSCVWLRANYDFMRIDQMNIQYNPDAACGGSWVYIENQATASLYNYTPYQPNQGALDAGAGTAHCGAYGNRNFWRFFNEWFGSPLNSVKIDSPLSIKTEKLI